MWAGAMPAGTRALVKPREGESVLNLLNGFPAALIADLPTLTPPPPSNVTLRRLLALLSSGEKEDSSRMTLCDLPVCRISFAQVPLRRTRAWLLGDAKSSLGDAESSLGD